MSLEKYKGFSRDAKLIVAYSFFGWLGGNIVWFIFPFYLKSLGMDFTKIGTLFSISTIVQATLLLISGQISVKLGYKRTILLALSLFFTARLIQVFVPIFWTLLLSSVIVGIAMALEWPSLMALLSGEVSEEKRHYLFTLNSALGTAGAAFGMLLGGILPKVLDGSNPYRRTLLFAALLILIQIALISFVSPVLGKEEKKLKLRRELLVKIAKFSIPSALIGLGAGVTIPYMGLYFNLKFETSLESIGGLFALQQLLMAVGMFSMPILADKVGSVKTIVSFNGSATALIIALPFAPSFLIASVIYIVRTILMNIVNPIWDAFMMRFFSKEERAASIALRSFAWTSTFGIGQYLGGVIFDKSLVLPFLITGFLYAASIAVFWMFFAGYEERVISNSTSF
ncbi:MFS transporter [Thermococcus sp. M39]|uniref:MFS transporter n=1 Tax=unclassified Thermococcus TaxID=2627626 RepID=UPI0014397B89|nr:MULTISPECIES: MFS transporter [unclassified Thermococcus]NJE08170.1 MFS transporter [Thermococcus sp. M39]NJE11663.1 MFS transporter [Thermococcus sp. LS2]